MEGMALMSCPRITCSRQHEKAGSTCACRVAYRAVCFMPGRVAGARQGYGRIRQDGCHAVLEQSGLQVWDCLWTLQKLALPRCKSQENEKHQRLLQTFHFLGPLQCFHFTTGDLGISSFFERVMPCLPGQSLNQCPVTVKTLGKCGLCSVSVLSDVAGLRQ